MPFLVPSIREKSRSHTNGNHADEISSGIQRIPRVPSRFSLRGHQRQDWFSFWQTGPQTTRIPGLFSSGEAGFAETIGWPIEGFRKVFREVFAQGMVKVDWKARLVWVPKAIHYNRPENPNVVKGWRDTWDEMPECDLKLEAWQELKAFIEGLGEGFVKAFEQACQKPSLKPLPNQEQEQEQEQDKERRAKTFSPPMADSKKSQEPKEPSTPGTQCSLARL